MVTASPHEVMRRKRMQNVIGSICSDHARPADAPARRRSRALEGAATHLISRVRERNFARAHREAGMMARPLLLALAALGLAGTAFAHHGWGSYDAAGKFTIVDAVERIEWQNPHVHLYVPYQGATWEAVLAPPFRMQARGLAPAMLKQGTRVAVEGYPSTQNQREMRAERIVVGGKTYELR
jgi:hypothetical protein